MKKWIIYILFASFLLVSCSWEQRDILSENAANNFVQKDISSPFYWDKNAKLQIVQFWDFQCPACIRFEKNIWEKFFNEYALTNKIGITFKNYPLSIHKNAPEDALAWLCAHEQWKYKEFAKNMYTLEEEKNWLIVSKEDRTAVAKKTWLNTWDFDKCVLEWRYVNKIKSDMADWDKLSLEGTPSVYANWTLIKYDSEEAFFKIIDQLLTK